MANQDTERNLTDKELHDRLERQRQHHDELRGEKLTLRERLQRTRDRLARNAKKIAKTRKRLRNRRDQPGAADAVKWAYSKRGVTESPYGSNWGEPVATWIRYTGYSGPVPWCGCFACYCVVNVGAANIPVRVRLGYHGYIIEDAKANRNGLKAVSVNDAQPGDIVAYDFAHIGVIVGPTVNGMVHTVEGNTSSSTGSQNNGGGVYERRRPVSDVAVIARPEY